MRLVFVLDTYLNFYQQEKFSKKITTRYLQGKTSPWPLSRNIQQIQFPR